MLEMSSITLCHCCLRPTHLFPLSQFWKTYPQNDKGIVIEIVPPDNEVISAFSDASVGDFTLC